MGSIINGTVLALVAVVLACTISLLLAWPLMLAWNYVMPSVFGLHALTWGQAWCLMFICNMLIKASTSVSKS